MGLGKSPLKARAVLVSGESLKSSNEFLLCFAVYTKVTFKYIQDFQVDLHVNNKQIRKIEYMCPVIINCLLRTKWLGVWLLCIRSELKLHHPCVEWLAVF
jgi:hypothetical protein